MLVTLKCTKCNRTLEVPKDDSDPKNTAEVHTVCDNCDDGDFAEVLYFDVNGKQILEF